MWTGSAEGITCSGPGQQDAWREAVQGNVIWEEHDDSNYPIKAACGT